MPNDYFHFKQFTIFQDQCAMKVSTDACIQGALATKFFKGIDNRNVLDIGTGTGLLSLMLAQELENAKITSIEIESAACNQAKSNFENSTWKERLHVENISIQNFAATVDEKFDAIICNPPFFHKHLNSEEDSRNKARHDDSLDKDTLAKCVVNLLDDDGVFCVLYPNTEWEQWLKVATDNGLHLVNAVYVFPNETKPFNRVVGFFGGKATKATHQDLFIYQGKTNIYTDDCKQLLQAFYQSL